MPRYTSGHSKKELETTILERLRKSFKQDEKKLPVSSENYPCLTAQVMKDVSKISADFAVATTRSGDLGGIVGVHEIDVPHLLSRAANPADFDRFRQNVQETYENATGKLTFLGLLTEPKNDKPPVFFLLYANGDELRAYVPKKGNSFDKRNKATAGTPAKDRPLHELFDVAAMKKDIQSRFQYVGDEGLSFLPEANISRSPGPRPGS